MSKLALLVAAAATVATAANAKQLAPLSPGRVGPPTPRHPWQDIPLSGPALWEPDQRPQPAPRHPWQDIPLSGPALWEEDQEQRWGRPGGTPPFVPPRPSTRFLEEEELDQEQCFGPQVSPCRPVKIKKKKNGKFKIVFQEEEQADSSNAKRLRSLKRVIKAKQGPVFQ